MKTQTIRLTLKGKERPSSIRCQQSPQKNALHSRSPFNPSKGKSPMKMKKFNSHQLFVGAHRVNGETFLPQTPQSAIYSSKHSTVDTPRKSKKSQLLSDGKSNLPQNQSKLQIERVVSINIDKIQEESGELTRLIQMSPALKEESFGDISRVEKGLGGRDHLTAELLKEIQLKKSDTIHQFLEDLKGHR